MMEVSVMKSNANLLTIAVAALSAALLGPTAVQAGGNGVSAIATGSGQIHVADELRTFTFNAQTDRLGVTSGQTQAVSRAAGRTWHGTIDCLNVEGNVATMSGVVTNISPETPPFFVVGSNIVFQVIDNGEGANAPPDLISLTFFFGPGPSPGCTGFGVFATTPVELGNVQVH
jgi:hypothetical protein